MRFGVCFTAAHLHVELLLVVEFLLVPCEGVPEGRAVSLALPAATLCCEGACHASEREEVRGEGGALGAQAEWQLGWEGGRGKMGETRR